ncbi:ABC transporter substrate-binding protein [uncultured Martelella sp.]|uniref:ABC transporter substrate-binding protein n=1 Tax=uncultured Martelella sp. TaxID=392331 RepID=UPI0029C90FA6|nr:ABC transporter substrate-binding protein [uncultured Martelella sp.]
MIYSRLLKRLALSTGVALALAGAAGAVDYHQAPMLDARVEDGSLPPVAERLPEDPYVETMVDGIGQYGGTLRTTILANGDHYNLTRTIANELLVRWDPAWQKIVPSLAEDVTVSDDATTYTFKLRDGLKWSDGEPFTVDDIMFWYEDVFMNEALTPSKSSVFVAGGKPVVVTKIDDDTVEFKFDVPYGLFLQQLAYGQGHQPVIFPKHYLSQFHEKYNADGIPALLAENPAANDWVSLFNSKVSLSFQPAYWQNTELPTMNPWTLTVPYADGERVVATRNPYYWKVDPDGNQLPYIDSVTWAKVDDPQLMVLKMTSGEFDFAFRHINNATFRSVLYDGQESGNYHFLDVQDLPANDAVLLLNLNSDDPVKNEVFNNKDFRIALSHAIDRQEIIDLIYVGQGTPAQVAVNPSHELYNEREATQYTEYDPDLANEMLDAIMPEKDDQGYRLGPDGQRFTINFMVADVFGLSYPDVMQMVQQYAQDVGIDIQIRTTDRTRLNTMWNANEQDAYIWNCVGGLSEVYTDVRCYMPYQKADIFFASKWSDWYSDHSKGEEPPEQVKELMAAYDAVTLAVTDEDRKARMEEFLDLSADAFLNIGIIRPEPKYMMVSNDLKNVYDGIPINGILWHPAPTLSQWYFDDAR